MSETTRMLRGIGAYMTEEGEKLPVIWRDLRSVNREAALAIEAVEAQVAEAVARVEKLSACVTATDDSLSDWAERHEKVLDRLAALETRPTIVTAGSQDDDRVTRPAPVRRFKVGDRVRFVAEPKWTSGYLGTLGTIERIPGEATLEYYIASDVSGTNGDHVSANDADLEPAPSAVPAPRGFRVGDRVRITKARDCSRDWIGCEGRIVAECNDSLLGDWRIGDLSKFKHIRTVPMFGENLTLVRAAAAPEAPAEEDTGLVVQRIRDEATKPLHVEIEKLRGEVARLTKERDEARAISAATAERVRNETQIATELRKDLDVLRAKIAAAEKERGALRAELDALKAKPRFRTRPVTAADVRALDDEWAKSKYVGRDSWVLAMRALGFRRRVDGAK